MFYIGVDAMQGVEITWKKKPLFLYSLEFKLYFFTQKIKKIFRKIFPRYLYVKQFNSSGKLINKYRFKNPEIVSVGEISTVEDSVHQEVTVRYE